MKYKLGDTVTYVELVRDAHDLLQRVCKPEPVGDVQGNAVAIAKHIAKVLKAQGVNVVHLRKEKKSSSS